MKQITVTLMEFNKNTRLFEYLKEVNLAAIPNQNDKIVIDIDSIGYVFNVYDVMLAEDGFTDVNIIRLSTITEYNSSKFSDII
jgi:hypothetical protein